MSLRTFDPEVGGRLLRRADFGSYADVTWLQPGRVEGWKISPDGLLERRLAAFIKPVVDAIAPLHIGAEL